MAHKSSSDDIQPSCDDSTSSSTSSNFEDILHKINDYGPYQKRLLFFFFVPLAFCTPWLTMNTLFMIPPVKFICTQNLPDNVTDLNAFFATTKLTENEQCYRYDNQSSDVVRCDSWLYDTTDYEESYITYVSKPLHLVDTVSGSQEPNLLILQYIENNPKLTWIDFSSLNAPKKSYKNFLEPIASKIFKMPPRICSYFARW